MSGNMSDLGSGRKHESLKQIEGREFKDLSEMYRKNNFKNP